MALKSAILVLYLEAASPTHFAARAQGHPMTPMRLHGSRGRQPPPIMRPGGGHHHPQLLLAAVQHNRRLVSLSLMTGSPIKN